MCTDANTYIQEKKYYNLRGKKNLRNWKDFFALFLKGKDSMTPTTWKDDTIDDFPPSALLIVN